VSVWREKILPLLLKITPEPKSVFVPYMVVSKKLSLQTVFRNQKFKYEFALEAECSACP
jgi:hypothetical protein